MRRVSGVMTVLEAMAVLVLLEAVAAMKATAVMEEEGTRKKMGVVGVMWPAAD